jgi:hypothetical protein
MMRILTMASVVAVCVLLLPTPNVAHHSFGAEYDAEKPITVKGVITKVEWANPHCHLYLEAKEPNGAVKAWKIEGYPPNVLARTGFKRDVTLKVGDTITIFAWLARNGSALAHGRELTLADGKKLYFGPPAGTGEGGALLP